MRDYVFCGNRSIKSRTLLNKTSMDFCPYFSHFLIRFGELRAGDIRTVLSISFLFLKSRRREDRVFLMSVKMKFHLQVHCKTP
jgi:hypothetical protein